jgi:hypothetical protein
MAVILLLASSSAAPAAKAASKEPAPPAAPAKITVESPLDYQVFQRQDFSRGTMRLAGELDAAAGGEVQFRITGKPREGDLPAGWQPLAVDPRTHAFAADVPAPAGGWYRLEVRGTKGNEALGRCVVEHVGVGEVFIVAGQSNSSNHGSEKQTPASGMGASFDGKKWALANDPQRGGSGNGGSFMPAFCDAMFARYGVPVGVAAVGVGATSVRQWLPKGERMTNQPTTGALVKRVGPGEWESTGQCFDGMMQRIVRLGPHGFRAILWHQGESDAGQARSGYPADRQITGEQYRAFMEKLIRATRERAGWNIPWFVAQATYHSEKDPADEEFRAAQKALWRSGLAMEGPDTDALRAEYRAGVHFNGKGLQAHGKLWAEKVAVYLDTLAAHAPAK